MLACDGYSLEGKAEINWQPEKLKEKRLCQKQYSQLLEKIRHFRCACMGVAAITPVSVFVARQSRTISVV